MSVSKLRESTEKKGCMVAVWVVMVLTALGVAGSGFFGCFNSELNGEQAANVEVLTVDGKAVTLGQINNQLENFMRQLGNASTPDLDFTIMSSILASTIDQQVMANMASRRGIKVDDAQILAAASDQIDDEIRQFRLQAVAQADLKETATESEFQNYFEEKNGRTTAKYKEERIAEVKKNLEDPQMRQTMADGFAMQELQKSFFNEAKATDDEIKKSYEKLQLLRITFDNQEKSLADREAEAAQALAELKAGANFLTVQKKYMKNPITEPASYSRTDVERNPEQKALAALKPGQHSEVIVEFGIPSIYKLVEIKSDLPADFEANKIVYGETVRRDKANVALQKAVDEARKSAKIEWKSESFETLYEVYQLQTHEGMSEEQAKDRLIEIMKLEAPADDVAGPRVMALARYGAMKQAEPIMTVDERKENLETISDVMFATLDQYESAALRLRLVDVYVELGQNEDAAFQLLTAAENNTGFEEENVNNFAQINAKVTELETEGVLDADAALEVRNVLSKWSQEKTQIEEDAKNAQSDLDKFNVDPETGKTLDEAAKSTADKALEEANKTTGGQGN